MDNKNNNDSSSSSSDHRKKDASSSLSPVNQDMNKQKQKHSASTNLQQQKPPVVHQQQRQQQKQKQQQASGSTAAAATAAKNSTKRTAKPQQQASSTSTNINPISAQAALLQRQQIQKQRMLTAMRWAPPAVPPAWGLTTAATTTTSPHMWDPSRPYYMPSTTTTTTKTKSGGGSASGSTNNNSNSNNNNSKRSSSGEAKMASSVGTAKNPQRSRSNSASSSSSQHAQQQPAQRSKDRDGDDTSSKQKTSVRSHSVSPPPKQNPTTDGSHHRSQSLPRQSQPQQQQQPSDKKNSASDNRSSNNNNSNKKKDSNLISALRQSTGASAAAAPDKHRQSSNQLSKVSLSSSANQSSKPNAESSPSPKDKKSQSPAVSSKTTATATTTVKTTDKKMGDKSTVQQAASSSVSAIPRQQQQQQQPPPLEPRGVASGLAAAVAVQQSIQQERDSKAATTTASRTKTTTTSALTSFSLSSYPPFSPAIMNAAALSSPLLSRKASSQQHSSRATKAATATGETMPSPDARAATTTLALKNKDAAKRPMNTFEKARDELKILKTSDRTSKQVGASPSSSAAAGTAAAATTTVPNPLQPVAKTNNNLPLTALAQELQEERTLQRKNSGESSSSDRKNKLLRLPSKDDNTKDTTGGDSRLKRSPEMELAKRDKTSKSEIDEAMTVDSTTKQTSAAIPSEGGAKSDKPRVHSLATLLQYDSDSTASEKSCRARNKVARTGYSQGDRASTTNTKKDNSAVSDEQRETVKDGKGEHRGTTSPLEEQHGTKARGLRRKSSSDIQGRDEGALPARDLHVPQHEQGAEDFGSKKNSDNQALLCENPAGTEFGNNVDSQGEAGDLIKNQVCSAASLVARALYRGPWPSPMRSLEPSNILSRLPSDYSAHWAHVSVVAGAIQQFAIDVILPTMVAASSNPPTNESRIFLGTLLMLREVMIQNAMMIFGPSALLTGLESDFLPKPDDRQGTAAGSLQRNKDFAEENALFSARVLVTAIVLSGLDLLRGEVSKTLSTEFLRLVKAYDRGDDEFVFCMGPIQGNYEVALPNGDKVLPAERLAWQISYNYNCATHPVNSQSRKRSLEEVTGSRSALEAPKLPRANAVHVSIIEERKQPSHEKGRG